jgi:hypothetical protein
MTVYRISCERDETRTEEMTMTSRGFSLHLIASEPSNGDSHVNPDATACELGQYETREAARHAGREYMRNHPRAWVQVQDVANRENGEDVELS